MCQPVSGREANPSRYVKQRDFVMKLLDGLESKRRNKSCAPQKSVLRGSHHCSWPSEVKGGEWRLHPPDIPGTDTGAAPTVQESTLSWITEAKKDANFFWPSYGPRVPFNLQTQTGTQQAGEPEKCSSQISGSRGAQKS